MLKVHKISIVINLSVTHILSLPAIFPKINNGYTKEGALRPRFFLIKTPALGGSTSHAWRRVFIIRLCLSIVDMVEVAYLHILGNILAVVAQQIPFAVHSVVGRIP